MSIPDTRPPIVSGATDGPPLPVGPILVAADGTPGSDAALAAAWLLSDRRDTDVQVLSVVEPVMQGDSGYMPSPPLPLDFYAQQRAQQIAVVRAQLARVVAPGCAWPVAVEDGFVAESLARHALALGARLVVLGRGRHGLAERVFGRGSPRMATRSPCSRAADGSRNFARAVWCSRTSTPAGARRPPCPSSSACSGRRV